MQWLNEEENNETAGQNREMYVSRDDGNHHGPAHAFEGADSGRHSSPLDSRTVPHPEWAQISGQIERTSTAGPNNGDASVRAIIRLSEGGHVAVDFGAAAVSSFRPKMDDFIHVRGEAIEKEGQLIVIAREVYAEGQVFRIPQRDETALEPTGQPGRASGESSPPLSPAAPAPRER